MASAAPVHAGREFELAVDGGGLVGMAIAWGLARRGRAGVGLEEGDLAFRASRGNFALVWVQSKGGGLSDYALWTMQSSRLWPQLADAIQEQTGIDVCFRKPGGLHPLLYERAQADRGHWRR